MQATSQNDEFKYYSEVLKRIKADNPDLYEKVADAQLGGSTGNECRMLVSNALWDIKAEEVSRDTYRLIPKAIRELKI